MIIYFDLYTPVLLNIVAEILPLGGDQWELVASRYKATIPPSCVARDAESLKSKFKTLRLVKKPTGDPTCPPEVKMAKRLYREIEAKASVVDFDEDILHQPGIEDNATMDDDEEGIDEVVDEYEGAGEPEIVAPATVTATPASASASASSSSNSFSSGRKKKRAEFLTTSRAGLTETQLINLGKSGALGKSEASRKKNKIDLMIEEAGNDKTTDSFMQVFLMHMQASDQRRLEAEERRLEAEERRAEERRQDRAEREIREAAERERRDKHDLLLFSLLKKD